MVNLSLPSKKIRMIATHRLLHFLLIPLLLWSDGCSTSPTSSDVSTAPFEEQTVEYQYVSFPSYNARLADGTLGPPEKRVFLESAQHVLTATVGEQQLDCPVAYQDVAYVSNEGDQFTARVLAYSGCLFAIKNLSVDQNVVLRGKTTLRIMSTEGNVLQLTEDSSLPWILANSLLYGCASAVNVVWSFATAGMTFETNEAIYTTTKPNASVAFTVDGVRMDGISKTDRSSAQQ